MDGDFSYSLVFMPRMMSSSYQLHFHFSYLLSVVIWLPVIWIANILTHFCVPYLLLCPHCAWIKNRMLLFFSFPFCILLIKFAFVQPHSMLLLNEYQHAALIHIHRTGSHHITITSLCYFHIQHRNYRRLLRSLSLLSSKGRSRVWLTSRRNWTEWLVNPTQR